MSTVSIAERISEYFQRTPDQIVCAYLFGSIARGVGRKDSDVDVAVLYGEEPPHTLDGLGVRLAGDLERQLKRTVDVVVLNHAPVDLVHRVLRDGVIVLDRDPSARIRFEVNSRNAYFDLQPILAHYRRGS